ncbi:cytochrome c oxidase cbb3-type subunit 4 [Rhodoligotrophos appendicifer]|uniref:cbb3-type cytochrome c oxidase subunit 3 n=1 Tax=Rhodoligotrophos appendicifer TaxID=987056 RepID=UPI0011856D7D|nr:cbb3-type cytochrome c oxidase subunit 3 [Rhodoligotrophos appendicifer]
MSDVSYEALRHFADSWGLVFLFCILVGIFLWVLRPGAAAHYRDQANIPFRDEKED